jgi:hypothetical protein
LGMHGANAEVEAIDKEFGLDEPTLTESFKNRYKAKHGVYPGDAALNKDLLIKEYGSGATKPNVEGGAESEASSNEKFWEAMGNFLAAHIKGKAEFFETVFKRFEKTGTSPIGDLEQLRVGDEEAKGRVKMTVGDTPNEQPPKGSTYTYDKPFQFHKIDGGWLIDSP